MTRLRKVIDVAIPVVGAIIVFAAVVLISDANLQARIFTVLAGVLLIEAGAWNLTDPLLPNDREYTELRDEVDDFIQHVRSLNAAAVEARSRGDEQAWSRYREALDTLHDSVDRMGSLAGKAADGAPTRMPESDAGEADEV